MDNPHQVSKVTENFSGFKLANSIKAVMRGRMSETPIETSQKKLVQKLPLFDMVFAMLSLTLLFCSVFTLFERQSAPKDDQNTAQYQDQSTNAESQILGIETQNEYQDLPVRLKISKIGVTAAIEYVGTSPTGEMGSPSNANTVGWFYPGSIPGKKGNAVIAGHSDGENGEVGVFADLHKLQKGDELEIEDGAGKIITFVVRESRNYDPGQADEVFRQNDSSHLNLVTCNGAWDSVEKSYKKRLVVFADIVD